MLPLSSKRLQIVVREPYTPRGSKLKLVRALMAPGDVLVARTKMHEAKVFFDGPDIAADLHFGDTVEFTRSEDSLTLLGLRKR
mgnify:CR=1 FL=1